MDAIFNTVDKMLDNGNIMTRKTSNDEDSFYITSSDKKETVDQVRIDGSRSKAVPSQRPQTCTWKVQAMCPHPNSLLNHLRLGVTSHQRTGPMLLHP